MNEHIENTKDEDDPFYIVKRCAAYINNGWVTKQRGMRVILKRDGDDYGEGNWREG